MAKDIQIKNGLAKNIIYEKLLSHSNNIKSKLIKYKYDKDDLEDYINEYTDEHHSADIVDIQKTQTELSKNMLLSELNDFSSFISNIALIKVPASMEFVMKELVGKEKEFFEKYKLEDNFYKLFDYCLRKYSNPKDQSEKNDGREYLLCIKETLGDEILSDYKVFDKIRNEVNRGVDLDYLINKSELNKKLKSIRRGL